MKKTLCILLALALVLGLAACGGGEPAASELPDPEFSLPPEDATPSDLTPEASPTPTPTPESIDTLKVCGISIITNGQLTGLAFKGVKYENGVLLLDSAVLDSGTTSDILIEFYGGDLEGRGYGRVRLHLRRRELHNRRWQPEPQGRGQPEHHRHRGRGHQRRGQRNCRLRPERHRRARRRERRRQCRRGLQPQRKQREQHSRGRCGLTYFSKNNAARPFVF
ncbi:MAG: hypothetical protein ACLTSG_15355 [Lachnospiraceae bacterium]